MKTLARDQGGQRVRRNHQKRVVLAGGGRRCRAVAEMINRHGWLVGVVPDDPELARSNAKLRAWRFPSLRDDAQLMFEFAEEHGIPMYSGDIREPAYFDFLRDIGAEICVLNYFGQRQRAEHIEWFKGWIFNLHSSAHGEGWPSRFGGPCPYEMMLAAGVTLVDIVCHVIDLDWDRGFEVDRQGPFKMAPYRGPEPELIPGTRTYRPTEELGKWLRTMHSRAIHPTVELVERVLTGIQRVSTAGHRAEFGYLREILGASVKAPV